ncbi:DUF998 domain-containing protein [Nocardia sp. GCM10030253]|uniref:DUF998 domain-containing protein n=1 Tax=Nocardia sp. GCM10030253 TaxID=3273404 RepID=UPI0036367530
MTDNRTGLLLACGVLATPLFFVVAFAQTTTRAGFDLGPHMISQLASGDHGWIQIANFVVTGILFILAAIGLRQAFTEGPGRVWIPRLVAVFGAGLIAAGVFVVDPVKGYPVGAVEHTTWHGILHGVAAVVAGLSMTAALGVFARRFFAAGQRGWAIASIVVAVVYLVLPFVNADQGGLLLAVASIIGWGWVSVLALRQLPAFAAHFSWGTPHPA